MDHDGVACFQVQEEQGHKLFVQIIQNGERSLERLVLQGCSRCFLSGSCRSTILFTCGRLPAANRLHDNESLPLLRAWARFREYGALGSCHDLHGHEGRNSAAYSGLGWMIGVAPCPVTAK